MRDKKREKVKGYFLGSKYVSFINDLIEQKVQSSTKSKDLAGALHRYAKPELLEKEEVSGKSILKRNMLYDSARG